MMGTAVSKEQYWDLLLGPLRYLSLNACHILQDTTCEDAFLQPNAQVLPGKVLHQSFYLSLADVWHGFSEQMGSFLFSLECIAIITYQ